MSGYALSKIATQLIYPLDVSILLLALALLLLVLGRRRGALALLALGLGLLWVASTPAVSFHLNDPLESRYPPVPPDEAPRASAIVLLGGAVSPPAPPRNWMDLNDSVDRIVHAARLYHAGRAPLVIVSGGGGPSRGSPQKPADVMADLLVEWGVPREALVLERKSRNTFENAVYSTEILEERGLHDALIVTSAAHLPRAMAVFEGLGVDAIAAGTDYGVGRIDLRSPFAWLPDAGALRGTSAAMKEYLGIAVYRLRGQIRRPRG